MPDPKTIERLRGLALSANDLKALTDWPDALVEDYLNILDNLILLADTLDVETDKNLEPLIYSMPTNRNFESRISELEQKLLILESSTPSSPKSYGKMIKDATLLALINAYEPSIPRVHPTVLNYDWLPATAVRAAGLKPATFTVNTNKFIVVAFADGQEEVIEFNLMIPDGMDRSRDSFICLGWSSPAVSLDCDWELTQLISAPGDDTDQAGAMTQGFVTSSATVGGNGLVVTATLGVVAGGTLSEEDMCIHCNLMRDGNDVLDTLGDVAHLHGISFGYIKNKYDRSY